MSIETKGGPHPEGGKEVPEGQEVVEFKYNETEAKKFGLERVDIQGNPAADRLIAQVINGEIDVLSYGSGQEKYPPKYWDTFVKTWKEQCPDILSPHSPTRMGVWYLEELQLGRIVSNLRGEPKVLAPRYGQNEVVLTETWEETDRLSSDASEKLVSPLLKELVGTESAARIFREVIDDALWQGDPGRRENSGKALKILQRLGLDQEAFELRLIAQDEYARLAKERGWGNHWLATHFDGYGVNGDGDRRGLFGCKRDAMGKPAYYVGGEWPSNGDFAVRLVVASKPKQ